MTTSVSVVSETEGRADVLVVGAGLAGLVAARELQAAGYKVRLIEKTSRVGGRVRSFRHPEGFTLDDGFQVLFDAYPSVGQCLNFQELDLQPFDAGAMVYHRGAWHTVAAPWRHPLDLPGAWFSGIFAWYDGMALARVSADALGLTGAASLESTRQMRTDAYLARMGLSETLMNRFVRPFFAGIALSRELDLVASQFLFYWRMLLLGRAVVPASGMQAIPDRLLAGLPPQTLTLGQDVQELLFADGRVCGVRTQEGREWLANRVVLATPHPQTVQLLRKPMRLRPKRALTLYFAAESVPTQRPIIYLSPDATSPIGTMTIVSNATPAYAPAGQHLVALQVLPRPNGESGLEPDAALAILAGWFPALGVKDWRFLHASEQVFAQFGQDPATVLDDPRVMAGLFLASETLVHSSIEGAMQGGQMAARAVIEEDRLRR